MFKKISKILSLAIILGFVGTSAAFAQTNTQSSNIQKAFENVRGQIDDLITAKDQNKTDELNVRIETFKKVIDLTISEAKDLKIKLLSFDINVDQKDLLDWQSKKVDELNAVIKYYESEKQTIENAKIDVAGIKNEAQKFKDWRETNYLPTANEINDFLLIQQEKQGIQTAKNRAQKISTDLKKLQKYLAKSYADITKLLDKANGLIEESDRINQSAEKFFFDKYINKDKEKQISSGVLSSSTEEKLSLDSAAALPNSTTSNNVNAPEASSTQLASIKDMVKVSLTKVRDGYQIFIEMSNLVRKLLK